MILGYIRCSTADQAKDNRPSLQVQTDVIEGIARVRGANKFDVQIFTDAGVSGATKLSFRPAGADLLKAMKPGDVVIASKLDRMFRSAGDAVTMFEEFKAAGVDLILYDISAEPLSSAVGKMTLTILAAVADMERQRILERTTAGRKARKERGGAIGEVPFGFRKVGEGRAHTLEPDEKEQAAQMRMKALSRTASLRQIGKQLAAEGFFSRAGTPFNQRTIQRLTA